MPSGALALSIGDVAGHDVDSAVAMAQTRGVLPGIQVAAPHATPGEMLTVLDEALPTLDLRCLATAVLARVEQTAPDARAGLRRLRWSNAGHPPPVLLEPTGEARLLATTPERLLGTTDAGPRTDHVVVLDPGATVVFYTDGLVERRGTPLDRSLDQLVAQLAGHAADTPDALCEHLLDGVDNVDDDVALLVLRARPEQA